MSVPNHLVAASLVHAMVVSVFHAVCRYFPELASVEELLVKSRGRFGGPADGAVDVSQSRVLPLLCPVASVEPVLCGAGDLRLWCGWGIFLVHCSLPVSPHSSWLHLL